MAHKIVNHENTLDNMKILLSEQSKVKEKVNLLEAVVQKMILEKNQLEAKAKNKKITIVDKEIIEEAIEEKTDCKRKQKKTDGTDVKQNYKPPIVEVNKDNGNQNNDLKCEICDFSCKKVNIMKKHMDMKHVNHKCKMCDKEFLNSMDALAHAAKDHI